MRSSKIQKAIVVIIILAGITITFRVALSYFFAQDDFMFLGRLAQVRSVADAINLFLRNDHFYRPLSRVVLLGIPYALFGTSALGYHIFGLGLHLINTVLVYRLLRALGASYGSAIFGACLYGFHAVHFVPIAWISGIQELAVSLFVLLASLSFLAWRRYQGAWRYGLSAGLYGAALLSKETAILWPLWLLAVDALSGSLSVRSRALWRRLIGPYLGLITIAIVFMLVRSLKADQFGQGGPYTFNLAVDSLWSNIRLYVFDLYGLHVDEISRSLPLAELTLVICALSVFIPQVDRRRIVAGVVWVICFLAPVLLLGGRHYTYYFSLPVVGVALAASAISDRIGLALDRRNPGRRWSVWLQIGLSLAVMSYSYARINSQVRDELGLKHKADRALQIVTDLETQLPSVTPGSTLHVVGATIGEEVILGGLFTFYYPVLERVVFDTNEIVVPDQKSYLYRLPIDSE